MAELETRIWLRVSNASCCRLVDVHLARSHGLQRVFIISPWISEFGDAGGMSFGQFSKRLWTTTSTAQ